MYNVCFLKKFNNYFNRIIKGFATLAEYQSAAEDFYLHPKPINFNFADNVSTELIMNDCPFEPDYLVLINEEGTAIDSRWFIVDSKYTRNHQKSFTLRRDVIYDNKEELRLAPAYVEKGWLDESDPFIFNDEGMNFNQIKIREYPLKDKTLSSWIAIYLSKDASASDVNIQSNEIAIDNYLTLATIASDLGITEASLIAALNIDTEDNTPSWFFNGYTIFYSSVVTKNSFPISDFNFQMSFNEDFSVCTDKQWYMLPEISAEVVKLYDIDALSTYASWQRQVDLRNAVIDNIITAQASFAAAIANLMNLSNCFTYTQYEKLQKYNDRIIKYNSKFYKLSFNDYGTSDKAYTHTYTSNTLLYNAFHTANLDKNYEQYVKNAGTIRISSRSSKEVYIHLTQIAPSDVPVSDTIPTINTKISSSRIATENQAFDLVVAPMNKLTLDGGWLSNPVVEEGLAQRVAAAIATQLGAKCYDIQLLPYCPCVEITKTNAIDLTNLTENKDYNFITRKSVRNETYTGTLTASNTPNANSRYDAWLEVSAAPLTSSEIQNATYQIITGDGYVINPSVAIVSSGGFGAIRFECELNDPSYASLVSVKLNWQEIWNKNAGILLYCKNASFRTMLDYQLLPYYTSVKVENLCTKYRLVSPNYQGTFDFSLAKNGMSSDYFLAECTYKPFTPYIKIAPEFKKLYGGNYGDARGLICSGDFSLPRFDSAWVEYELQNKNYQNIFNRDIQNLDFEQGMEKRIQMLQGLAGIAGMGVAGAAAGASAGGLYGAAAGGVIGATGGFAGMIADYDILSKRHKEAKDLAIDKFNYQLGNIKALPYTLTKVGSFNINSKIWPFLELYSCTEREVNALEHKIKYESMTIMRIDYVGNYFEHFDEPHYFKAQLIRNEEIADGTQVFDAIYSELLKGVYF